LALLADIISVVVFCTVGRRSHAEGRTAAGIGETAWPFLPARSSLRDPRRSTRPPA